MTKVDEIVYAKWDTTSFWYLAQVVSVSMGSKTTTYTLHFMDGFDKQGAAEKKLKKVPAREKKNKPIGKKFFDKGDYRPGDPTRTTDFVSGEFTVLCYQPASGGQSASYWCERNTGLDLGSKREIEEFGVQYAHKLIQEYDHE